MEKQYIDSKIFDKQDFSTTPLPRAEYEKCRFVNCNFSNADLSGYSFTECEFNNCNLSLVKLVKTGFREITLKNCKVMGVHFHHCNEFLFSANFEDCLINLSSFYKLTIKKTKFKNSSLHEVDFTEANLTGSVFENCDLTGATFENSVMERADLRTAYNYSLDPELNKLKKAKFSVSGLPGLLNKYDLEIEN